MTESTLSDHIDLGPGTVLSIAPPAIVRVHSSAATDHSNAVAHFSKSLALMAVAMTYDGLAVFGVAAGLTSIVSAYLREAGQITKASYAAKEKTEPLAEEESLSDAASAIAQALGFAGDPQVVVRESAHADDATAHMASDGTLVVSRILAEKAGWDEQQGAVALALAETVRHPNLRKRSFFLNIATAGGFLANAGLGTFNYYTDMAPSFKDTFATPVSACAAGLAAGGGMLAAWFIHRSYVRTNRFQDDRLAAQASSPTLIEMTLTKQKRRDEWHYGPRVVRLGEKIEKWCALVPTTTQRCAAVRRLNLGG
jgi:hypothetical protein